MFVDLLLAAIINIERSQIGTVQPVGYIEVRSPTEPNQAPGVASQ